MTNLEAYSFTYKNPNGEGSIRLTLTINGIDPDASDQNELSLAYAILDQVTAGDWKQGDSSETLSSESRGLLIRKAQAIFIKNNIDDPFPERQSTIDGIVW